MGASVMRSEEIQEAPLIMVSVPICGAGQPAFGHPEPQVPKRRALFAAAALFGVLTLGSIANHAYRNHARTENVIMIVADAMRGDCIGKVINGQEVTPHLNALAQEGTVFSEAYSAAYSTKPSVASLLSGMYPPGHGVEEACFTFPDCPNIVDFYKGKGYKTAAIITSLFLRKEKDIAKDNGRVSIAGDLDPRHYFGFWKGVDCFMMLEDKGGYYFDGARTVKAGLMAIDKIRDGFLWQEDPFFSYMHLMETHRPYIALRNVPGLTGRFHKNGGNPDEVHREDKALMNRLFFDKSAKRSIVESGSEEDVERLRAIYYESAFYIDSCVGALISGLKERGIYGDTMIIFTADHGEELLEKDVPTGKIAVGHERPALNSLHVPLIIKGRSFDVAEVKYRVSNAGVFPTLLEIEGNELSNSTVPSFQHKGRTMTGNNVVYATAVGKDRVILQDGRSAVEMKKGDVTCRKMEGNGTESPTESDGQVLSEMAKQRYWATRLAEQSGIRRMFSTHDWQNPLAGKIRGIARGKITKGVSYHKALKQASSGEDLDPADFLVLRSGPDKLIRTPEAEMSEEQREQLRALGYLN